MGRRGDLEMMRVLVQGRTLDEGEQHHLRVRRAQPGELVELRDGSGMVGTGRLTLDRKEWGVDVEMVATAPRPADLVLALGAGDRDRFGWVVEKAAELGVTVVVPLETARTAGVASKLRGEQIDRLRRRALEAVKQSGAAWAPVIDAPVPLEEFAGRGFDGARWLADAAGESPPAALAWTPVAVVVGPEGGLTEREREVLHAAGFVRVALGPCVLRFETAAVAAAVAVTLARQRGHDG